MSGRIWYPQLDIYDTVRRLVLLLASWKKHSTAFERLYIADFYLANPPLLHKTSMPRELRLEFGHLQIPRPEKTFLSYPTPIILFHKMEPIQKKALQALLGRSIADPEAARRGFAQLTDKGTEFANGDLQGCASERELSLVPFLTDRFAVLGGDGTSDLRKRTGLRRPV